MQPILLSHWCKLIESFQFSPLEFYGMVERAAKKRDVPGLGLSRVEWKESGFLSKNRVYLRLARQRLYFDVCAAPFGTGFFVSSRLTRKMFRMTILKMILLALAVLVFLLTSVSAVGFLFGIGSALKCFALLMLALFGAMAFGLLLCNLDRLGLGSIDEALMAIPVLSDLYEGLFRPMTYFRIDQMLMYQEAVHSAVMEAVDEMVNGKSVKPLTELERRPIFAGLLKR